jgi:hypothetical protein
VSTRAFVPLKFELGEAFQFDWSEERLVVGGIWRNLQLAHLKLCASRAFVLVAYPSQGHEMLFDAHTRSFQALGGIARRGIYDNMKTAVDRVKKGKGRVVNARFLALCSQSIGRIKRLLVPWGLRVPFSPRRGEAAAQPRGSRLGGRNGVHHTPRSLQSCKPHSPRPRSGPYRPLSAGDPLPRPCEWTAARGENRGEVAGLRGASQPNGRAGGARHGGGREA